MRRHARSTLIAALGVALVAAAGTPAGARPRGPQPGAAGIGDSYYPGYGNGGYDVGHYDLVTRYDTATNELTATATLTARATQDLSAFNLDLFGLTVDAVTVDGAPARTARAGSELTVTPAAALAGGATFRTVVRYHGRPQLYDMPHTGKSGWFRTSDGVVVTGQPEGAASWFPCNDHPRDKATFTFAITVPKGRTAIANGVPRGTEAGADGWTTFRYAEDSPMAPYLTTATAGDFKLTVSDHGGRPVVFASKGAPSAPLRRTPEVVDYLAGLFGPYPFSSMGGIAGGDVPGLSFALEIQTRPVYSGSASDLSTVVHENAHQWFGDSVALHDWKDIWLNEGFATYAEWLWADAHGGPKADATFQQLYKQPQNAGHWAPATADPKVAGLFGSSVYTKGAMTLHALRRTVGDEKFFAVVRAWAARKKNANGTTAEFVALAGEVAGKDLSAFFQNWLYATTKPPAPPRALRPVSTLDARAARAYVAAFAVREATHRRF
ncbi:peptidase [Pilimelia terevasa]|uniref:Aminopeptidase N n=1 Tax=Pilimelia terevasa TaxID=53372 RepID=A0A8J3FGW8_9ACTN|nr:M1 family metallopeptidase [Pilimelia terevasa]GGK26442.1 peptidase [Pilimelia terevasa]